MPNLYAVSLLISTRSIFYIVCLVCGIVAFSESAESKTDNLCQTEEQCREYIALANKNLKSIKANKISFEKLNMKSGLNLKEAEEECGKEGLRVATARELIKSMAPHGIEFMEPLEYQSNYQSHYKKYERLLNERLIVLGGPLGDGLFVVRGRNLTTDGMDGIRDEFFYSNKNYAPPYSAPRGMLLGSSTSFIYTSHTLAFSPATGAITSVDIYKLNDNLTYLCVRGE